MAFTCGFFNSENGDRKYNAEQMSAIFDGIIADGVFTTIGDHMAVSAGTGMQVLVGTGKAWFDHTWNVNDAAYPLAIAASDVTLSRIDAIVLETNHSDSVRLNKLRVVQGTVASSPAKPTLTNSEKVHQHPLAWVTVAPGVTQIAASAIENAVGTSACPFVTGIIATTAIDDLFNQWNGEFDEWFENLKAQLSDNVVANLQKQIDANTKSIDSNWQNTLKSLTKSLLGLDEIAVPDDAFLALAVGVNNYVYKVHLQLPDGTPISNVKIGGLAALEKSNLTTTTNSNGDALGISSSPSPTLTATSPYIDIKDATKIVTSSGKYTEVIMEYPYNNDPLLITSSKQIKPSKLAIGADICLVGGGGGGGSGDRSNRVAGGGGGGGYVTNQLNLSHIQIASMDIRIGAGGSPQSAGGTTTVTLADGSSYSAPGGSGGTNTGTGGQGNGNGGSSNSSGNNGSRYLFDTASLGLAGGGGGGGGYAGYDSKGYIPPGGSPKGGKGGAYYLPTGSGSYVPVSPTTGETPGGGGGGGYYEMNWNDTCAGAYGGNGGVYIRFKH